MKNRKDTSLQAKKAAYCGMAAALSVVLMMLSSVIPIFGYIGPMFASVLLIPLMKNFGKGAAMCTWLVTALLILILGADKEAALFYIFFGYYPVLKTVLDRIPQGFFRRLCKFAFFLLSAILMDVLLVKIPGHHHGGGTSRRTDAAAFSIRYFVTDGGPGGGRDLLSDGHRHHGGF